LGLTSAEAVHPLEDLGTMRALQYLQDHVTQTTPMTVAWLRRLHRLAFGDLYTWAGEYRTVQIAKEGKRAFSAWCPWQNIPAAMDDLERNFLRALTPVSPKQVDDVPRRVAILISEFLLIHPFREGNGRIAQMMGNWVALQAGLPTIAYGIDEDSEAKDAYIVALQQGYNQNYAPLERFVQEGIERSLKALRRLKLELPLPGESGSAHE
jgi:cell filamentation protein